MLRYILLFYQDAALFNRPLQMTHERQMRVQNERYVTLRHRQNSFLRFGSGRES